MRKQKSILIISLFFFGASLRLWAPPSEPDGEWPNYGGDPGSSHYSRLTQINKTNVQQLQLAWEWNVGEEPMPNFGTAPGRLEATPLMINDVLYLPTAYGRAIALDANTGKQLWSYDPHMYEWGPGPPGVTFGTHRGLATWTDGKQRRLLLASRGRLFALDAQNGRLIPTFGKEGIVDVTETLVWKLKDKSHYENSSPGIVYKDLIIVGSAISDSTTYSQSPPGDIQAFNVRTGKHVWSFHTIAQSGEFGNDTWEDGSWKIFGHANAWPPLTLDEKRGLLYLPVTTPANDHFGGGRKGNNLFADSLVCLDANTGKRVWHFQTVHHGLWDYDGVMTPNLVTIHVNGKTIDAVAAVSKTGFTYVFDRVTGQPVWPIEERPVPQSDVPGEKTSPTQPFPTKPPAFAKQGITEDDVVDFTPEIKRMAMEKLKEFRFGPIFNPPSIQGTLMMPSNGGGANWGSAAVDLEKGILFVKSKNVLRVLKLTKQDPGTPPDPQFYGVSEGPYKYGFPTDLMMGGGLFLNKPPYGTVTSIDLNKGEILWQAPVGDIPAIRNNPLLKGVNFSPTGAIGNSGSLVTAGGLVFNGPGDNKLYALDEETGNVLWAGVLKNPGSGTPMTYRTRSGRQFIVVATGGGKTASLEAFALPEK